MSGDLAETAAYIALRRLQNTYADIVTRRSWAELHNIMKPDCLITVNTLKDSYEFDGPTAIGNFISGQLEQFSFFEFVVLNTVMEIDSAAGTAGARMYMQELRQGVDDGRRTDAYGVYHDRFERDDDGRWWFARRRYQSFARTSEPGSPGVLDVFDLPVLDLSDL